MEHSEDPDKLQSNAAFHLGLHHTLFAKEGAQWLSGRVLYSRPQVLVSPVSLCCVLEQEH